MRVNKSGPSLFGSVEIRTRKDNKLWMFLFLNHVDWPIKTGFMINNGRHAFSRTLWSRLLCVWCRKKRSMRASLKKQESVCFALLLFLLVEKVTPPTLYKIKQQTTWFGCLGTGGVVGGTVSVIETAGLESLEIYDIKCVWNVLLVCYVVFILYICIISIENSSLNIFVVFTVKNLNFIYSDFMFFVI